MRGVIQAREEMAMRFPWRTEDGEERQAHAWPAENSRGVVACVHGLSGSGEQFAPLPERLGEFSFYALDLRGQGSDPLEVRRGLALDLEWQMRDVGAFLKAVGAAHSGEPLYLMGESMGSLLSASYAARAGGGIEGLILSVPVVGLAREVPAPVRWVLRVLGKTFPKWRLSPSRFVNGKSIAPPITRDRVYQDSLREKPHHISNFSLGFLAELGELIDGSHEVAGRLELPVLVLAAGQDCFVRVDQVEEWFQGVASRDKTLRVYPEAYHLLWHDWDREKVVADLGGWLRRG
jgi:alpha-beta hydrolase superfamily lysophospholipase